MLQTIEIEIDADGRIHPLEPLPFEPTGRALLTLLDQSHVSTTSRGSAEQALALLASPRFAARPAANPDEVSQRITAMRDGWGDRI